MCIHDQQYNLDSNIIITFPFSVRDELICGIKVSSSQHLGTLVNYLRSPISQILKS